jgi:hypothetical protein
LPSITSFIVIPRRKCIALVARFWHIKLVIEGFLLLDSKKTALS